jgi:hypothetical protein
MMKIKPARLAPQPLVTGQISRMAGADLEVGMVVNC